MTTQTWLQVSPLAQRFRALGCPVSALCPDESPLAFTDNLAGRYRFSPFSPLRSLRQAIDASSAERLVPTDDLSVWLLHDLAESDARMKPLIEQSIGKAAHYQTLSSRNRLLTLARQLGIRTPASAPIHTADDLHAWRREDGLPFVLKKDGTWGGQGVQAVRSLHELDPILEKLNRPESFAGRAAQWLRNGDGAAFARPRCLEQPEMLAQAWIEGVPANAMYACHEGHILGEVHARVAATRGKMGPSIVIQLIEDSRMQQAGARIARALQLSGFFGLDFMLDSETGLPYLIECNPRATRLGHIQVSGQPDLAELLVCHWTGRQPAINREDLTPSVWFYPDGKRLTEGSAGFPGFRPDAGPDEMAALERRMREEAPLRVRVRRSLWKAFSRTKGSLSANEQPGAYYYPLPELPEQPWSKPGPRGGRKPAVAVIAG